MCRVLPMALPVAMTLRLAACAGFLVVLGGAASAMAGVHNAPGSSRETGRPQDLLCAGQAGRDAELCRMACRTRPAPPECLMARRFGAIPVQALTFAAFTGDVEAAARRLGIGPAEARRLRLWVDGSSFYPGGRDAATMARLRAARAESDAAVALHAQGRFREGRERARAALETIEGTLGPDSPETATVRFNLGALLRAERDLAAARPLLERALAVRQDVLGPDHPDTAWSLDGLAALQHDLGDLAGARALAERALAARELVQGPDHPDTAMSLARVAAVRRDLGDAVEARRLLERALAIPRGPASPGSGDLWTAGVLGDLGVVLHDLGDLPGARSHQERALAIRERLAPEGPDTALTHTNLGVLLHEAGDLAGARAHFESALALWAGGEGGGGLEAAITRGDLALVLGDQGKAAVAREEAERAVAAAEEAVGPEHPASARLRDNLAYLYAAAGETELAREQSLAAARSLERHFRRSVAAAADDRQLRALLFRQRGVFDGVLSHFDRPGDEPIAFERCIAWQGAAAGAEVARRDWSRLRATAAPATAAALARYEAKTAEYESLLLTAPRSRDGQDDRGAGLERLTGELDALAGDLRAAGATMPARTDDAGDPIEAACAALRASSAVLVDYVLYARVAMDPRTADAQPHYAAFVVVPEADGCAIHRVPLGAADAVSSLVDEWRAALDRVEDRVSSVPRALWPLAALDRAAADLRAAVWDPVAGLVPPGKGIRIVPDGRLNEVSFAAMPLADGRYLVETAELAVVAAPAWLSRERPAAPAGHGAGALVVGDVDYARALAPDGSADAWQEADPPACRLVAGRQPRGPERTAALRGDSLCGYETRRWDPLTPTEAGPVADRLCAAGGGQVTLVTSGAASEPALSAALPGHRIVHVATHGFFSPAATCDPGTWVRLGGGRRAEAPDAWTTTAAFGAGPVDPLLLSGLVLAGADAAAAHPRDPAADGLLSAREVVDLDLSTADLVVLSACTTGRGEAPPGEGPLGLGRAFQLAGAGTVVVALWSVTSDDTTALFESFYEELAATPQEPVRALRAAQLDRIQAARAKGLPGSGFLWGAFVPLVGGR